MHALLVTLLTIAAASVLGFTAVICTMAAKRPSQPRFLTITAKTLYVVMVLCGLGGGAVAISMDISGRQALVDAIESKYDVTAPEAVRDGDLRGLNPWTIDGRDYLCRIDGPADVEELFTADPTLECVAEDEVVEFGR